MWIEPKESTLPIVDNVNERFKRDLKGELSEDVARRTLGEFLHFNVQFTTRLLTGMILKPFQAVLMKGWFLKNFSLAVWGRGCAKSSLAGIFAILYCIFNPNTTVLIVSSNFRSSRRILETLEALSKRKSGVLLRQVFETDLSRRNDIFKWTLLNGSSIVCLPLGDGEGLRGQRANVLIVDEALLVPKHVIENVLKPFLVASGNITEKLRIREIEDDLVERGIIKDSDRRESASTSKMILLSSASYQAEYFYEVYQDYMQKIIKGTAADGSYYVSQMSYKVVQELAPEILDKAVLEDINSGNTPQAVIDREYNAHFIQGTDGFFRAVKLIACTIPDGSRPCVEIVGEPGEEYVLGIDPNMGGDETNDHFAMCVLKIVKKPDGRKIGLVVHSYAAAGVDLKDHINYVIYILKHFNIVYIAVDSTQGDNMGFIAVCNESDLFKGERLFLKSIDAEFGREDVSEIATAVRRNYNRSNNCIVQQQNFHTAFIGAANDLLQAHVDNRNILFAGRALSLDGQVEIMKTQRIGNICSIHKLFNEEKDGDPIYKFIEMQDILINKTKIEMAHIQVTVSQLGNRVFNLPQNLRHVKQKTRIRRDSYSALLLANWGLYIYLRSLEVNIEKTMNTFAPSIH